MGIRGRKSKDDLCTRCNSKEVLACTSDCAQRVPKIPKPSTLVRTSACNACEETVCESVKERERARERDRRGAEGGERDRENSGRMYRQLRDEVAEREREVRQPKPQILNPKQGCQIEALKPINRAEHFVCVLERTNGSNKYL